MSTVRNFELDRVVHLRDVSEAIYAFLEGYAGGAGEHTVDLGDFGHHDIRCDGIADASSLGEDLVRHIIDEVSKS